MKKFSIILNIVLLIACIALAINGSIQTSLAAEQKEIAEANAERILVEVGRSERLAADAKEAEARALRAIMDLQACMESK